MLEARCRFCDCLAKCEFGRDEIYCSAECARSASIGSEALEFDKAEVAEWLCKEGVGKWRSRLCKLATGEALLANLTEGELLRAGVPRPQARHVMHDVEFLRQGAWLQPEPPREIKPLGVIYETGSHDGYKWEPVLNDPEHRSFASLCRGAIDDATASYWFLRLRNCLPWQDLVDEKYQKNGKTIPRRTIFTVSQGCNCVYKYSGVKCEPFPEPDFVAEIRRTCVAIANLKTQPNACNINLYRSGHDSVGWHTDNEDLFEGEYNDITILSLSLGSTRNFSVKKITSGPKGGKNDPTVPVQSFAVSHGDLCTMEGRFQHYYLHAVPKMPWITEPRINLTWRWITKHNQTDGCHLHGPGN